MASLHGYLYSPISHPLGIRLFVLNAATGFDAPLRGSLQQAFLPSKNLSDAARDEAQQATDQIFRQKPPDDPAHLQEFNSKYMPSRSYTALSYAWGTDIARVPLRCDEGIIRITPNCDQALRHLRHHSAAVVLWVDSICINQMSEIERNQQVAIMGHIYKSAASVLIWLGPSTINVNKIKLGTRYMKLLREILPTSIAHNAFGTPLPECEMVEEMVQSPWYTRIWTLQEQILPNDTAVVKWGEYEMKYVAFQELRNTSLPVSKTDLSIAAICEDKRTRLHAAYNNLMELRDPPRKQILFTCLQILHTGRMLSATDPRDRLYGSFAILRQLRMPLPGPDYFKSVEWVYENFARYVTENDGNLLLLLCSIGTGKNLKLPSWVPDWTVNSLDNDISVYRAIELLFGNHRANLDHSKFQAGPAGQLRVSGSIIGKLTRIADRFRLTDQIGFDATPEWTRYLFSWFELAQSSKALKRLETILQDDTFGKLSNFSQGDSAYPRIGEEDISEDISIIKELTQSLPSEEKFQVVLLTQQGRRFLQRTRDKFLGATLFTFQNGFLGCCWYPVPKINPAGGLSSTVEVAVLAGSSVPVMLRSSGPSYELVGPLYAPDLMNREWLDKAQKMELV